MAGQMNYTPPCMAVGSRCHIVWHPRGLLTWRDTWQSVPRHPSWRVRQPRRTSWRVRQPRRASWWGAPGLTKRLPRSLPSIFFLLPLPVVSPLPSFLPCRRAAPRPLESPSLVLDNWWNPSTKLYTKCVDLMRLVHAKWWSKRWSWLSWWWPQDDQVLNLEKKKEKNKTLWRSRQRHCLGFWF